MTVHPPTGKLVSDAVNAIPYLDDLPAETLHAARLAVADHATDTRDLAVLLATLGLADGGAA